MSIKIKSNQKGMVSIMVTMIMILVISLIVLGFAQVTRRNQRENLDNQLSSQAFYAAETGVNDAKPLLQARTTALNAINCTGASALGIPASKTILNATDKVAYTCLNVSNTPATLQYQTIANDSAVAVPLNTNSALSSLTLSWQTISTTGLDASACASGNQLPPSTTWGCSYGLLRLDLMKDTGQTGAVATSANTLTFYLKPSSGSDAHTITSFSDPTRGVLLKSVCASATKTCKATLGLSGSAVGTKYYARITAVYRDLQNVVIGSQQAGITFTGAQATVDSTGKAQDVLRRIQVRVPLTSSATQAAAALQSTGSICKLISVSTSLATDTCDGGVTTGGSVAPPPPAGGPNTKFDGRCGSTCAPSSGPPSATDPKSAANWTRYFFNHSSASAPTCKWDFGDGATKSNTACTPDQYTSHEYPHITTCKIYKVVLTMYYSSGAQTYTQSTSTPKVKPDGSPGC